MLLFLARVVCQGMMTVVVFLLYTCGLIYMLARFLGTRFFKLIGSFLPHSSTQLLTEHQLTQ